MLQDLLKSFIIIMLASFILMIILLGLCVGATPSLNTSFSGIFSYNYDAGKGATSISSRFILIVM